MLASWITIIISLCILIFFLKTLINILITSTNKPTKLPPGPLPFPLIGNLLLLYQAFFNLSPIISTLSHKYGSLITLHIGSKPTIFVASLSLAHQSLIQNGAIFADRSPTNLTNTILGGGGVSISGLGYGTTWGILRRNLTSKMVHPSRLRLFSSARKHALEILLKNLKQDTENGGGHVVLVNHLHHVMYCFLVFMCFGYNLDSIQIEEIEKVIKALKLNFFRFIVFGFLPKLTKIIFRQRWKEFTKVHQDKENLLLPLIKARRKLKEENRQPSVSYADTLLDLQNSGEIKNLTDVDIVSLCTEFLTGACDTTMAALQWTMANLVKHPDIQQKVYEEMKGVVGEEELKEDDLNKLPFLKAVILEALRRHPPTPFLVPRMMTKDVDFGGYVLPENVEVNFSLREMARDPNVWEDPMEFRPERFLNPDGEMDERFDITGTTELKMMPFGAGRRICPGYSAAIFHLQYFVGNLVRRFKWMAVEGDDVDLTEKVELTIVMKTPLTARISPRFN